MYTQHLNIYCFKYFIFKNFIFLLYNLTFNYNNNDVYISSICSQTRLITNEQPSFYTHYSSSGIDKVLAAPVYSMWETRMKKNVTTCCGLATSRFITKTHMKGN